jgi:hypothetical protein
MERHQRVKIREYPTTNLPNGPDHGFYLDHLIKAAIEDGCTHIAILHVDSFPVRSDWVEQLSGKLSESYVFAAPYYGAYTACLFFRRDFYLKYRPTFLIPEDERSSEKYKNFCKTFEHIPHAGAGYLFKAYSEGLSWYPLQESNKGNAHYGYICSVYDDLVFHLGAVWSYSEHEIHKNTSYISARTWTWKHLWFPVFRVLSSGTGQQGLGAKKSFRHLMSLGWRHLGFPMFFTPVLCYERKQLLEDPGSYLNYIRTGKRCR